MLRDAEIPDEFFYYWNDATNSSGYAAKLGLMFSAVEVLAKIKQEKKREKFDHQTKGQDHGCPEVFFFDLQVHRQEHQETKKDIDLPQPDINKQITSSQREKKDNGPKVLETVKRDQF